MTAFVRTVLAVATIVCLQSDSTLSLVGVRGPAHGGVIGVLTDLDPMSTKR